MEISKSELKEILALEKRVQTLGLIFDFEDESNITIIINPGLRKRFCGMGDLKLYLDGIEMGKTLFSKVLPVKRIRKEIHDDDPDPFGVDEEILDPDISNECEVERK